MWPNVIQPDFLQEKNKLQIVCITIELLVETKFN